jgi:hypothetical protein
LPPIQGAVDFRPIDTVEIEKLKRIYYKNNIILCGYSEMVKEFSEKISPVLVIKLSCVQQDTLDNKVQQEIEMWIELRSYAQAYEEMAEFKQLMELQPNLCLI